MGSTDPTIDRSSPGKGIYLRRPDGTLREITIDNNDDIALYDTSGNLLSNNPRGIIAYYTGSNAFSSGINIINAPYAIPYISDGGSFDGVGTFTCQVPGLYNIYMNIEYFPGTNPSEYLFSFVYVNGVAYPGGLHLAGLIGLTLPSNGDTAMLNGSKSVILGVGDTVQFWTAASTYTGYKNLEFGIVKA